METTKNNIEIGYKVHLEEGKDFNTSIFKSVYESAKESVKDIVVNTVRIGNHNYTIHKSYNDDYNNIIAFTGERGRGKSSSMISFLDAIVNKSKKIHMDFFVDDEELSWTRYSFATIDVIDPTLFREREKETLFEIVIAKMFSAFRKTIEDKVANCNIKDEQRRSVIKSFQNVFENLKYLKNRDDIFKEDALDALIKLSTSSNLKDSFDRLVEEYLEVLGEHGKTNFLVIAIDDFDLKIDGVYEMLEDVRRFLISRKIILLISCKMEQMRQALKLYMTNLKINDDIQNQVEKYIEKLFPVSRIIEMPSPQDIEWNEVKLRNFFYDDISNSSEIEVETTFNRGVLRKIYEKLGLFIAEDSFVNNLFIGNSMRSVIGLKRSWNDIESFTKYVKTYLNQTVIDLSEINFILESDIVILNYQLYNYLYDKFGVVLDSRIEIEKDYKSERDRLFKSDKLSYDSYQNEDMNSLFFTINGKIKLDDADYDLYRACKLFYILRKHAEIENVKKISIKEKIEGREKYIVDNFKKFNLGSLINVNLLSDDKRFTKDRDFLKDIKYAERSTEFNKFISPSVKWLLSFVYSIGKKENRISENAETFFGRSSGQYFSISIFNFFNSINSLESRFRRASININQNDLWIGFEKKWHESKYFKLFNNLDFITLFYSEMIKQPSILSKNRELLLEKASYSEFIHSILTEGFKNTFNKINEAYGYLKLSKDEFTNQNKLYKDFLESYSDSGFVEFMNNSFESLNSDNFNQNISNQQGLLEYILEFLEERNRKINTLKSLIEDNEPSFDDSAFTTLSGIVNKNVATGVIQEELIETIKSLIEDGQSAQND